MALIKTLIDENEEQVLPRTSTDAVQDEDGVSLTVLLSNITGSFVATYGTTSYVDIDNAFNAHRNIVLIHNYKLFVCMGKEVDAYKFKCFFGTTCMDTSIGSNNTWTTITTTNVATLDSPSFTGTPTSTTPTSGDSSTKIATTAFVASEINTTIADALSKSY